MNRELLKLALPNVLSNLSVPLVSLVDVGLMGHMPGPDYIVAIGFGVMIFNFLYWSFGFLRMGTTGITAQALGANDQVLLLNTFLRSLFIALAVGMMLILFQEIILDFSLMLINPKQEIASFLREYFRIRIYAAPATISIYAISGWFFGMQNAKASLLIALIVNGVNALLSYLFVAYFHWGMEGVAYGTLIAQYLGLFTGVIVLFLRYPSLFSKRQFDFSFLAGDWTEFLRVNSDLFIRTLFLIFALSFFKVKAGNAGEMIGAANILLLEFITLSAYGIDGFAFASESLCGKYFGRKDERNFLLAVKLSFYWGIGIAFFIALLFAFVGRGILSLLTNQGQLVDLAMIYMPWLIVAPLVNAFAFIWDGIFVGVTASKWMRNSMVWTVLVVFLPSYFIFEQYFGNHGVWLALSLFMLSRGLLQSFYYRKHILPSLA